MSYVSPLSQRRSIPGDPMIRARRSADYQHPHQTQILVDRDLPREIRKSPSRLLKRTFAGGIGPQILQEIAILPDEVDFARTKGWEVPQGELDTAQRVLKARLATAEPEVDRPPVVPVILEWGTWDNPQPHLRARQPKVQGFRATVGGVPASTIYPEIPERFKDANKYEIHVAQDINLR